MRRRLLAVILGTVALSLLLASVVALVGIRSAQLDRAKANLVRYAEQFAPSDQARTQRGLVSVQTALGLETALVQRYPVPGTQPSDPTEKIGMTAAETPNEVGSNAPLQAGGATLLVTDRILPKDLRTVAAGGVVTGILGDRVFAVVRQSRNGGFVDALLLVTPFRYSAWTTIRALIVSTAIALALASLLAVVFARRLAKPLISATNAYRRIASGDLSVRVGRRDGYTQRTDEIGDLMRSLDTMADSLDRAQKQEQQFLLSVSHDLRTPLTSIRGFAEAIAEGTAPDHVRAGTVIAAESRRLERLVGDLLELAKLDARRFELHPRRCDLTDLVTDSADGFLPSAERDGLAITLSAEYGVAAMVDPERVAQMLANLIENATKFARSKIAVSLRTVEVAGQRIAEISIRDDGPGIDPADLPHIFERLYTSDRRPTRQLGSGLGLAIVRELADAMRAELRVNTDASGTEFAVCIATVV